MPKSPERSIRPQQIHKKLAQNQNKSLMIRKELKKSEKTILSGYKSQISYEFPKNRGKILENFRKPKNQKSFINNPKLTSTIPKRPKRHIKTQTKSRTFHKVQKDP